MRNKRKEQDINILKKVPTQPGDRKTGKLKKSNKIFYCLASMKS